LGGIDLAGRTIADVDAYGKHLLIRVAGESASTPTSRTRVPTVGPEPLTLHTHLRMDGSWSCYRTAPGRWPSESDHSVRAVLANAEWTAVGYWLGMLDMLPTAAEHTVIGHLGPDLMADNFPDIGLPIAIERFGRDPGRPIGAALLDQT